MRGVFRYNDKLCIVRPFNCWGLLRRRNYEFLKVGLQQQEFVFNYENICSRRSCKTIGIQESRERSHRWLVYRRNCARCLNHKTRMSPYYNIKYILSLDLEQTVALTLVNVLRDSLRLRLHQGDWTIEIDDNLYRRSTAWDKRFVGGLQPRVATAAASQKRV